MSEHPNAHYIHERVLSSASEFERRLNNKALSISARLNAEMDMNACHAAAALIIELDTEVFRLRQAIGNHYYGMLMLAELSEVAESWNGENTMRPGIPNNDGGHLIK